MGLGMRPLQQRKAHPLGKDVFKYDFRLDKQGVFVLLCYTHLLRNSCLAGTADVRWFYVRRSAYAISYAGMLHGVYFAGFCMWNRTDLILGTGPHGVMDSDTMELL